MATIISSSAAAVYADAGIDLPPPSPKAPRPKWSQGEEAMLSMLVGAPWPPLESPLQSYRIRGTIGEFASMSGREVCEFAAALRQVPPAPGHPVQPKDTVKSSAVRDALAHALTSAQRQETHLRAPELWCALDRKSAIDQGAGIAVVETTPEDACGIADGVNPLRDLRCQRVITEPGFNPDCVIDVRGLRQQGRVRRHAEIHLDAPASANPDRPLTVISHEDVPVYLTGDAIEGFHVKVDAHGDIVDIAPLGPAPQVEPAARI